MVQQRPLLSQKIETPLTSTNKHKKTKNQELAKEQNDQPGKHQRKTRCNKMELMFSKVLEMEMH